MTTNKEYIEKAVEVMARAACSLGPHDPDEIAPNGGPYWKYYVPGQTAALKAYLEMEPSEGMRDALYKSFANFNPDALAWMLDEAYGAMNQSLLQTMKEME